MIWYIKVLRQYSDFNGRARRTEFWMFFLFNLLIWMCLFMAAVLYSVFNNFDTHPVLVALLLIYFFGMIIPTLAVTVRRLHDVGKDGLWILLYFLPLVGGIWLLVLMCTDGIRGANKHGPDPKGDAFFNGDALDGDLIN